MNEQSASSEWRWRRALTRLQAPQRGIAAAQGDEFVVAAALDDAAGFHHVDAAGMADGGQPVRDDQAAAAHHQAVERALDGGLGFVVHGRGGLVENQDRRVLQDRARQRQALPLPTRELHAALADGGVVALGQGGDEVMRTQKGNNNVWCQDNELSWFDWSLIEKNADILTFFKKAVTFRKMYSPWDPSDQKPHIQWFDHILQDPKWDDPTFKTLCFQFKPMEIKTHNSPVLFVVLNINHEELAVALPQHENSEWLEYVDTARPSGEDFFLGEEEKVLTQQNQRLCAGRSIVILRGKTK